MSDTGVVDPIRIPAWLREPAERWWREMPPLARVFVVLTVIDIVGRSLGVLAPTIAWGYITPLSFVSAYVPHDLWILLPALLLIRRPDAMTATPWVFRGALIVAIAEVARGPVQALLYAPSTAALSALVGAAAALALAAAWVALARGLLPLTPRDPEPTVAGVANLAVGFLGILAALWFAEVLVSPAVDVGDPGINQAITISSLAGPVQVLAWAYLVWVVLRGFGDARRPTIAVTTAAVGAAMAAFIVPATSILARLLGAVGVDLTGGSGFGEVFLIVGWLGDIVGPTLVALAFAIGLAEPPFPYVAPEPPAIVPLPPQPEAATEAPSPAGDSAPLATAATAERTTPAGESTAPPDEEPAILPE